MTKSVTLSEHFSIVLYYTNSLVYLINKTSQLKLEIEVSVQKKL